LSVSDTAIEGIQATVDFQAQVLTQVQQTINDLDNFLAENVAGGPRADLLEEVSFTLPSTLSADVMDNTSHSAGDDVNFGQFIGVVEAFKEKLREYKGDQNDSLGNFLSTQGTYTGRDSSGNNSITFDIGYGVPTDVSLSDDFPDSNLPESSILFSDAEFLNRLLGAPNVINDGYLDDVTRLFQAFAGGGIESIGVELGIKDVTIGELGEENNELLGQIAAFVEAVYEGRGPEVETDPENVDAQTRNPFGGDYDPDGDGETSPSPLQAYYDAAKEDSANGDATFASLRAAITESALGYDAIIDLIEDGLSGFSTPYQDDINDKFGDITAATALRDQLAFSVYNTAQQQFNLQTQLDGGSKVSYADTNQGVPAAFYSILFIIYIINN